MKLHCLWGPSLWAAAAFFLVKPQEALSVRLGVAPTEALNGVIAADEDWDLPEEEALEDDSSFAQLQTNSPKAGKKSTGEKGGSGGGGSRPSTPPPPKEGGNVPTGPDGKPIPAKARKLLGIN
ncbi:hypothetical protein Emed_006986 [Eimeria media]